MSDEPEVIDDVETIDNVEPLDEVAAMEDTPELVDDADVVTADPAEFSQQRPRTQVDDVSAEDREFIRRVFYQVKDVDFRSPPPPPRKGLSGPDKKVQFLRDRVRELERDLARVGYVWGVKEQQVEWVEKIIADKEWDRTQAVQRLEQVKTQSALASQRAREEISRQADRISELTGQKGGLEEELRALHRLHESTQADLTARLENETAEKTALVADFRQKIEQAQSAFEQLRNQSGAGIVDLEQRLAEARTTISELEKQLAEKGEEAESLTETLATKDALLTNTESELQTARNELGQQLAMAESKVDELSSQLEDIQNALSEANELETKLAGDLESRDLQLADFESQLSQISDEKERVEGALAEKEKMLSTLTDEMKSTRTGYEERVSELKSLLAARDEEIERIKGEVQSARSEFSQLAEQSERLRTDLEAAREDARLSRADAAALSDRLNALDVGEKAPDAQPDGDGESDSANSGPSDTPSS